MSRIECKRCFRNCSIPEGERGACWIIGNDAGEIKLLEYGMVSTVAVGPVEEKGIFHFHPGMKTLSIGGYGCNLRCKFCQNHEISQTGVPEGARYLSPDAVIEMADEYGAEAIAFTYSEPLIWTEYVIDVFKAARAAGLYRILKTSGAASEDVFKAVMAETDAVNIDFKGGFDVYDKVCGVVPGAGGNGEIGNNTYIAWESDVNLEMTVLVYGDTDLSEEGDFSIDISYIYSELVELSHQIPIHLVGVLPNYRLKGLPPSRDDMSRAAEIARECFSHVYVHEPDFPNDTLCPFCDETIIMRKGLAVGSNKAKDGAYPCCGLSWERVWIEPRCHSMTTSAKIAT